MKQYIDRLYKQFGTFPGNIYDHFNKLLSDALESFSKDYTNDEDL